MEPTALGPRFDDALDYASHWHRDDLRKGTTIPYLSHPLAVASLVIEEGADEDVVIAALLHDIAEDHGGEERLTEITERFGARVADIVRGCSDSLEPEGAKKPAWKVRKQNHLAHLMAADRDVARVVLADKLHNARCILRDLRVHGDALWRRFNASKDEILWYQGEMLALFEQRRNQLNSPMLGELRWTVRQIQGVATKRQTVQLRPGANPAVDAYIHKNGDLVFEEQVIYAGGEDSEYLASVSADRKDDVLLALIRERFTGIDRVARIEEWLQEREIAFDVFVY